MSQIFAGIHIPNKPRDFLELTNINFGNTVRYLKDEIAKLGSLEGMDGNNLEIVYNGTLLKDDETLEAVLLPDAVVHCFMKTNKYVPYTPSPNISSTENLERVQELFNVIAHIQINVSSRVNILQKILNEYPEFRRNLGAQALIRDSVLLNTLHTPEVVRNAVKTYPIIIEAASFIVDTVKKELTRTSALQRTASETANDSTNSSEEDSADRTNGASARATDNADGRRAAEPPNGSVRAITHQQLRAALANITAMSLPSMQGQGQGATAASASSSSLTTHSPSSEATTQTDQPPADADMDGDLYAARGRRYSEPMRPDEGMDIDIPSSYRNHQYAEQLRSMAQMGFRNYEENLQYLDMTNGNIENAVNLMMAALH